MKTTFINWVKNLFKNKPKQLTYLKPVATPEQEYEFYQLVNKARADSEAYLQRDDIALNFETVRAFYKEVIIFYLENTELFEIDEYYFPQTVTIVQFVNCQESASFSKKREIAYYFFDKAQELVSLMKLRKP